MPITSKLSVSLLLLLLTGVLTNVCAHTDVPRDIRNITHLIELNPAEPHWYHNRGALYRSYREWDHALTDFRKAQQLDPTYGNVELELGRTWLLQGSPRQAIPHLDRALDRQPNDVHSLVIRAQCHRALGQALAAAADYDRAIVHYPSPGNALPGYYLERARALAAAGDAHITQALQGLDAGMQTLGTLRVLALTAVVLETKRGNYTAALQRLDAILAHAARKEFLLLQRGDILVAARRHTEAQQAYRAAQVALAALPPRHHHTRAVQQLAADLTTRLQLDE